MNKRAIAKVTVETPTEEPSNGTAFFIGGRFAVTALHVVADTLKNPCEFFRGPIRLEFVEASHDTTATVRTDLCDTEMDWAVLECEEPPPTEPIALADPAIQGESWEAFGYPEIHPEGMVITGDVRDPAATHRGAPAIQLYCEEASAGAGAPLHGLSGAPCLVNGKAVGALRATLIQDLPNGALRLQLFTQAGTVYATPAYKILARQWDAGPSPLPGSWSSPVILSSDFLVFLSEAEAQASPRLEAVVRQAHRKLGGYELQNPHCVAARKAFSSEDELHQAVRALCRARVVVFDATAFDPAVMILAGIRAVVRRGVTILSVGGSHVLGNQLDIPFSLLDANIVAHSQQQNDSRLGSSVELLTTRLRRGLQEIRRPESSSYQDLPVFEAIRKLPASRRGVIPKEDGVLVLCSFEEAYTKEIWEKRLKPALENELDNLRGDADTKPPLGVARSFELNSPRLVTQAIYEAIRRAQACVVDLTGWSPSVLFELGVRLAASTQPTACIVEKDALPARRDDQGRAIRALFVAPGAEYDASKAWEDQEAFQRAYGPEARLPSEGPASGSIHALIERALDVSVEPASLPVYQELRDSAQIFGREPGRSKPVGLFPGHRELPAREEEAEFERLLAVWFYMSKRFTDDEILGDAERRGTLNDVIQTLFERHHPKLRRFSQLHEELNEMLDKIESRGGRQ